jgi:8-oxo-dGTP pyrophosphatase MutT (NUDIX family)
MPDPRHVPRKISAGVILVDADGRVLMQLRDDTPGIMFPDHWGLIGGAGHPGETPEETALREVLEETGLTPAKIEPFRAYYFAETKTAVDARRAAKSAADYELYLFHAPCTTPAEELVCGEGRELRFHSPDDTAGIDIAYNHREVLADFFASSAYGLYLRGVPFGDAGDGDAIEPLAHFLAALDAGTPWFEALMQAIALWEQPGEIVDGRAYRYLIGGEAFDWLLLAERLLAAADGRVPSIESERLLFEGRAPAEPTADPSPDAAASRISDDRLRALIGESKHRAHLNYLYGVTVEEALQYAVELEVSKERLNANIKDARSGEEVRDPIYERIYGQPRAELLAEFREQAKQPDSPNISLAELREFMYWLFKFRVKNQEPARVASDTRKALSQLSAMEVAIRRSQRQRPQPAAEGVAPAAP